MAGMADACDASMHDHLDVPDLGEDERALLFRATREGKAVAVLLECKRVIAEV
jgi:hypothetical protein